MAGRDRNARVGEADHRQGSLFDERAAGPPGAGRPAGGRPAPVLDAAGLSDQDLVSRIPSANLDTVEALCAEAVSRGLGDAAASALESLWRRFAGSGKDRPLLEQRCALDALAELGTPRAREALGRIVAAPGLPDALLPLALRAAARARVPPPGDRVAGWLAHASPEARAAAHELARAGGVPDNLLEAGLSDPDRSVRRACLVTLGTLGNAIARAGLVEELARAPDSRVARALAAVADPDAVTHLGRCAMDNPALADVIAGELEDMDDPRAARLAARIRAAEAPGSGLA